MSQVIFLYRNRWTCFRLSRRWSVSKLLQLFNFYYLFERYSIYDGLPSGTHMERRNERVRLAVQYPMYYLSTDYQFRQVASNRNSNKRSELITDFLFIVCRRIDYWVLKSIYINQHIFRNFVLCFRVLNIVSSLRKEERSKCYSSNVFLLCKQRCK